MLHPELERRFTELLDAWRAYDECSRVDLWELGDARMRLYRAQQQIRLARLALSPEAAEAAGARAVVHCASLNALVHVRWESPSCLCGEEVAVGAGSAGNGPEH